MRMILFIGLVVTAVILVSGCLAPTTNQTGTPGITPVATETTVIITTPVATETPFIETTPTMTEVPTTTGTPTGIGPAAVTGTAIATGTAVTTGTAAATGTPLITATPISTATGTATASMTVATVNITSTGYNPAIISIPSGTTVTWTNTDIVSHTVTSNTGDFDSGSLYGGQRFSWKFSTSGSYNYGDTSNASMVGTVIVTS